MGQYEKILSTEGHLIDSGLMKQIFDTVIADGGSFEVLDFDIGRTNNSFSTASIKINAETSAMLDKITMKLSTLGCHINEEDKISFGEAPSDGVVPFDFYSTTNYETKIKINDNWTAVDKLRMDGVIVVKDKTACVKKFRDVKKGDKIVLGLSGVKVIPEYAERSRSDFSFMSNEVSTERKVRLFVDHVASLLKDKDKKVVAVAGPVVIHTGGGNDLAGLIDNGHIKALLSGNALAVHDIESQLFGTSLGISLETGRPVEMGHRNHLRAINEVNRAGSIKALIDEGKLTGGVMYSAITKGIPSCLAGSLRDDGPIPETITDMNIAQDKHFEILKNTDIVLMLSSMLHSIAVGNMIPGKVLTVCVDINPAVVTKLKDRGSHQTIGLVTDVGLFLHLLNEKLIKK